VLPKIEASRDADAPDVQEMVVKLAEAKPQKLRQIGLNYDIANAKGIDEPTEEEKKKREQKKKEVAEKKKKKLDQEAKEKKDFEAWKREEKADYEAWKREKARHARLSSRTDPSKVEAGDNASAKDQTPAPNDGKKTKDDVTSPSTVVEEKPVDEDDPAKTDPIEVDTKSEAKKHGNASDNEVGQDAPEDEASVIDENPFGPASIADGRRPGYGPGPGPGPGPYRPMYRRHPESMYGDMPPQRRRRERSPPPPDNAPKPWNAVCVLGLRVYSQDPDVSIKLVKPKDVEEGAILDVDGDTPAGATM
jgi:hypothetical protein